MMKDQLNRFIELVKEGKVINDKEIMNAINNLDKSKLIDACYTLSKDLVLYKAYMEVMKRSGKKEDLSMFNTIALILEIDEDTIFKVLLLKEFLQMKEFEVDNEDSRIDFIGYVMCLALRKDLI